MLKSRETLLIDTKNAGFSRPQQDFLSNVIDSVWQWRQSEQAQVKRERYVVVGGQLVKGTTSDETQSKTEGGKTTVPSAPVSEVGGKSEQTTIKGAKGDKGDAGDVGPKGDTGAPGTTLHELLTDLAGGSAGDHSHITSAQNSALTGGGDTSLHYHSADRYMHPTGDGYLHVPATGTSNNGKVLTAGSTPGSLSWTTIASYTDAQADARISVQKGAKNGLATLDSGSKIPLSQIPASVIVDTFVVSSQSAMLALSTAQQGDVAIRTDLNKTFILSNNVPGTLENWKEMLSPTNWVSSVALSLPTEFSVSGSPITSSGTLTASWSSQTAAKVFASPSLSNGSPSFRALVWADISSAISGQIPSASSTTPAALGAAAVGTGTTWARADHVHAMPTAAQVGAQPIGNYAICTGAYTASDAWTRQLNPGAIGSVDGNPANLPSHPNGSYNNPYFTFGSSSSRLVQIAGDYLSRDLFIRSNADNNWSSWCTIWTSANLTAGAIGAAPSVAGGYLPLSAGSGYPLTDRLHGTAALFSSTSPFEFSGTGTGIYTKSVLYASSDGITLERGLVANSSGSTPIPFRIARRGGTVDFEVGSSAISSNLPSNFTSTLSRGGYTVWDAGNLSFAGSGSASTMSRSDHDHSTTYHPLNGALNVPLSASQITLTSVSGAVTIGYGASTGWGISQNSMSLISRDRGYFILGSMTSGFSSSGFELQSSTSFKARTGGSSSTEAFAFCYGNAASTVWITPYDGRLTTTGTITCPYLGVGGLVISGATNIACTNPSSTATTAASATVLSDGFNRITGNSTLYSFALPTPTTGRVIRVYVTDSGSANEAKIWGGTDGTTYIGKDDGSLATSITISTKAGVTFIAFENVWYMV